MDLTLVAGVIAAEQDPPGIDRAAWRALAQEDAALRPLDTEAAEALGLAANREPCGYHHGGTLVGVLAWSESGGRELDVFGDMDDHAPRLAAALGARYVTLLELTSC